MSHWLVYPANEDDPNTHIVPEVGPAHELDVLCWCHPDPDEEFPEILIHHIPQ